MKKTISKFFSAKSDEKPVTDKNKLKELEKENKELRKQNKNMNDELFSNLCQIIKTRRSIRHFSNKEIDDKIIYDILESAVNVPCAGNIQNYQVIVVRDKDLRRDIGRFALNQGWMENAPVHLVVLRNDTHVKQVYTVDGHLYSIQSVSAFIQNLLILIHGAGLGGCWVGAYENQAIKDLLGIPGNKEIDAIIPVGYSLETPKIDKDPMVSMIFYNKHGNRKK